MKEKLFSIKNSLSQLFSSIILNNHLVSHCYYLSAYSAICYYAIKIIMTYGIGNNDIYILVDSDDYFKLTASAVGFLSTDMLYKWWNHTHPVQKQTSQRIGDSNSNMANKDLMLVQSGGIKHSSDMLYYSLQVHHIVGICCYLIAWYIQKGQLIVSNLSLFEISSIPLLFYSDRILVSISLPATWVSYLIFRILWGNWILIDGLKQLFTENIGISLYTLLFLYSTHIFFLVANNYWFYLLTRKLVKQIL